jgi:hypothetical protein
VLATEIRQNLQVEKNAHRRYLMRGVRESIRDHANSHLDVRFIQSSTPAVIGPKFMAPVIKRLA